MTDPNPTPEQMHNHKVLASAITTWLRTSGCSCQGSYPTIDNFFDPGNPKVKRTRVSHAKSCALFN